MLHSLDTIVGRMATKRLTITFNRAQARFYLGDETVDGEAVFQLVKEGMLYEDWKMATQASLTYKLDAVTHRKK